MNVPALEAHRVLTSIRTVAVLPSVNSSVPINAVLWHPQRLLGLALIEGLKSGQAIDGGRLAVDVDAALAAACRGADILLVAEECAGEELRELIEALHHRQREIPVLTLRSSISISLLVEDLERGANGAIALQDGPREAEASIRSALRGLIAIPPQVQAGVLAALAERGARRQEAWSMLSGLTGRERAVLELLVTGAGCSDIAARLAVSANTVRTYLHRLRVKLGARTQLQLAAMGRELLSCVGDRAPVGGPIRAAHRHPVAAAARAVS
jgi:DNA-binding NarL/FixJ family response regulator